MSPTLRLSLRDRRGGICAGIEMQDRPYIFPPQRPYPDGEQDDDCRDNQCVMPPWSNHEWTVACGYVPGKANHGAAVGPVWRHGIERRLRGSAEEEVPLRAHGGD